MLSEKEVCVWGRVCVAVKVRGEVGSNKCIYKF